MGWIIAIGVLVLLAVLPLGVSAEYDSSGARVRIIAGPVKLQVFPVRKKKQKKPKAKKEKETASNKKRTAPAGEKKKRGGSLTDFLPLVRIILDFMGDFRRKLRVDILELDLVLAGGDPCDLAVNYGRACAALGNLWPRLEELFVIKKRDVKIQCDFEADKTLVSARLDLTITLARVFSVGFRYGYRAVKELLKILNKRKGGATT